VAHRTSTYLLQGEILHITEFCENLLFIYS